MNEVTRILSAIEAGDANAINALLPVVYDELRRIATQKLANERPGHTLQATALVHEAYLRLAGSDCRDWQNRSYFFGAAAEAMRRILIDNARAKQSLKRGGDKERLDIMDIALPEEGYSGNVIALDDALTALAKTDPTKAELVKLRFFAGLTFDEAAKLLNISTSTAKRHWAYARAWLYRQIRSASSSE